MSVQHELPPRPALAFRVGITGTREFAAQADTVQARIRDQIQVVLEAVRDKVAVLSQYPELRSTYDSDTKPRLRLLSPLAEGADQLAAEVATDLGYAIEIVLPFAPEEYARDFKTPASHAAFDRWIDPKVTPDARPYLALDGGRGSDETASYEAVGRLVVRNCDLLVAVWDGLPARGRGGTGDIVRFAVGLGIPVWWIDATGAAQPRLLGAAMNPNAFEDALQGEAATKALGELVQRMLLPARHRHHGHSLIGRLLQRLLGPGDDTLQTYLHGRPLRSNPLWRAYRWIFRVLGGPRSAPASARVPVPPGPAAYWETLYQPADDASTGYADRYRSSYVWIFFLATLAVVCAVAALAHEPWKPAATVSEIVLLGLILALVAVNERRNWHGRWIACRLLAELCRKQGALATLGWSLPPSDLRRSLHTDGTRDDEQKGVGGDGHASAPAEAWVGWYFDAALRAAPLPQGVLSGSRLVQVRDYVRDVLAREQEIYHKDRHVHSRQVGLRLVRLGEFSFLATLILVLIKLVLLALAGGTSDGAHGAVEPGGSSHGGALHGLIVGLGAMAAVLPAASAAFFGIRSYTELELLESQSARMTRLMAAAAARIDHLDLNRPLASQDLAAEVLEVSSMMLEEVGGWADLFRVKAVEAG